MWYLFLRWIGLEHEWFKLLKRSKEISNSVGLLLVILGHLSVEQSISLPLFCRPGAKGCANVAFYTVIMRSPRPSNTKLHDRVTTQGQCERRGHCNNMYTMRWHVLLQCFYNTMGEIYDKGECKGINTLSLRINLPLKVFPLSYKKSIVNRQFVTEIIWATEEENMGMAMLVGSLHGRFHWSLMVQKNRHNLDCALNEQAESIYNIHTVPHKTIKANCILACETTVNTVHFFLRLLFFFVTFCCQTWFIINEIRRMHHCYGNMVTAHLSSSFKKTIHWNPVKNISKYCNKKVIICIPIGNVIARQNLIE